MQKNVSLLVAAGLALVLIACGKSNADADTAPANAAAAKTGTAETDVPAPRLGDSLALAEMTLGSEDAPVTVIEYASVTCPGCAYFHQTIYPKLKSDYIETGKVKFIFREFPTPPQQLAYLGFLLSRCSADSKGAPAYFAMIDTLFKNQKTWVSEGYKDELLKYAAQTGMNEDGYLACIARQEIIDRINANITSGVDEYDVSSTPTFILNGEKMARYNSEEEYFTILDQAIAAVAKE